MSLPHPCPLSPQGSCFAHWTGSMLPPNLSSIFEAPLPATHTAQPRFVPCPLAGFSLCSSLVLAPPVSPAPPLFLSPFLLPAPLPTRSLVFQTTPALQNSFTAAGHSRGRKDYGKGQSFQSLLGSQISCSKAEGSWKDRSRKPTGIEASIICQQYAGSCVYLISLHLTTVQR